jgi:hypothetical protein
MTLGTKAALLASGLALFVVPAVALASGGPSNPGVPDKQPAPKASLPAKAKAYGHYCQNQSKKHVAGQKGTPFSQCVTAMAKLATGTTASPRAACATMSKKHVTGQKGTPFSNCVSGGAKLLKDHHKSP